MYCFLYAQVYNRNRLCMLFFSLVAHSVTVQVCFAQLQGSPFNSSSNIFGAILYSQLDGINYYEAFFLLNQHTAIHYQSTMTMFFKVIVSRLFVKDLLDEHIGYRLNVFHRLSSHKHISQQLQESFRFLLKSHADLPFTGECQLQDRASEQFVIVFDDVKL